MIGTRWTGLRWAQPLFNVLVIVALLWFGTNSLDNSNKLNQLAESAAVSAALQQTQAVTNRQQSALFNNILVKFFNEQAFLCRAAVAHSSTLGGPTPPPGICNISFPTPSPSG